MKKLFSLLILAALVLAACGGGSGEVAAIVDGSTEVTVGDVEELIDLGEDSTISTQMFADFLGFAIQWIVIADAADADFEISFTDEEIETEATNIYELNAEPGVTREDFLETNGVTEEFLLNVAHQQLIDADVRIALEDELEPPSQEDIDAQLQAAADNLVEVCAAHILVETEAEAQDALDRMDDGESFEDLAMELSLDPGSGAEGGDLGCSPPSRFVTEFADATLAAEIGVVTDPVESEFGFHLILVEDRTEPAPEDLPSEQEIIDQMNALAIGQVVNDWFLGHITGADVEIVEKFGTWQTEPTPGVVPPVE